MAKHYTGNPDRHSRRFTDYVGRISSGNIDDKLSNRGVNKRHREEAVRAYNKTMLRLAKEAPLDWVTSELRGKREYIDLRHVPDGALWVKAKDKNDPLIAKLIGMGAPFRWRAKSEDDCRLFDSWKLEDYPEKKTAEEVRIDIARRERRRQLGPGYPNNRPSSWSEWEGMRIFHLVYGYGNVVSVDASIAMIRFEDKATRQIDLEKDYHAEKIQANERYREGMPPLAITRSQNLYVGDHVIHRIQGEGIVDSAQHTCYSVSVAFAKFKSEKVLITAKDVLRGVVRLVKPQDYY